MIISEKIREIREKIITTCLDHNDKFHRGVGEQAIDKILEEEIEDIISENEWNDMVERDEMDVG